MTSDRPIPMLKRPRFHKILSDLIGNPVRSILVVASITIGLFAFGLIANIIWVIPGSMRDSYASINPANIIAQVPLYDKKYLEHLRNIPGVAEVEGSRILTLRLQVVGTDRWTGIDLKSVPDFDTMQIDRVRPLSGVWPPGDGQIVLDISKHAPTNAKPGDRLTLQMPSGRMRSLEFVGIVQDISIGATSLNGSSSSCRSSPAPCRRKTLPASRSAKP